MKATMQYGFLLLFVMPCKVLLEMKATQQTEPFPVLFMVNMLLESADEILTERVHHLNESVTTKVIFCGNVCYECCQGWSSQ